MASVAIAQEANIGTAIDQALGCLALDSMVRGKLVAVKPNDTWASEADRTAVTQPDTLRAVLRHLRRFAPRELVVSGGAGAAETDEVFRVAGLMKVIEEEGAVFFDHNRPPFREVALAYAPEAEVRGPQQTVMVNPRVLEYETLVSLAQLKMHGTATVTLGLKNVAMSFPAADYYGHPRHTKKHDNAFFADMHSFIAAMARRFPIHLNIIVGHPAMIGSGPIGGYTFETGLAIASTDPVAADAVGARLLGFWSQGVRHLWEAGKLGLGEDDVERVDFPAMSMKEAIGAFTEAAFGKRLTFEHP